MLAGGSGWFLDNGEGSEEFGGSFRGKGRSQAPLHLVRVALPDHVDGDLGAGAGTGGARPRCAASREGSSPTRRRSIPNGGSWWATTAATVRWRPGATTSTGPASTCSGGGPRTTPGTCCAWAESGQLLTYDYDHDRGLDQAVVLDIETGDELARVDTTSPVQCVLFPGVGLARRRLRVHLHHPDPPPRGADPRPT